MADWYSTFCALAGVDPTDTVASRFGLPPIDSLDMWSYLSGAHSASPRTEVPLSIDYEGLRLPVLPPKLLNYSRASALIQGDMKLLEGVQILTYYQGPDFPNSTSPYGQFDDPRLAHLCVPGNAVEVLAAGTTLCTPTILLYSYTILLHYTPSTASTTASTTASNIHLVPTTTGCLYNITADETEAHDLAREPEYKEVLEQMKQRMEVLRLTKFDRNGSIDLPNCQAQIGANGNFYGPWLP
jgi:hypothetical protein